MAAPSTGTAIVIDPRRLSAFIRSPEGAVFRDLVKRGERVKNRARDLVGKKSMNLHNHILKRVVERNGVPVVEVGFEGVPYGVYHHEGTAPHVITGNPLLVFFWPKVGKVVAFPRVNHPGTRPNKFLLNALPAAR